MSGIELFQRLSIATAARQLEVHPFDVVRLLVAESRRLPSDLRLSPEDLDHVRTRGGLEYWWEAPPMAFPEEPFVRALVRAVVRRMMDRDLVDPHATRADNLFRGLDPQTQVQLRKAVNLLIRDQLFTSRMAAEGLMVALHPDAMEQLGAVAAGRSPLLDAIWDRL